LDLGNDNHSSKIIALPLVVPRRLQILNDRPIKADTREIRVAIKAEAGFDPATEVDVPSLTVGAPTAVDFGKGCKPLGTEIAGKDLIVTFAADGNGFTADDYVGKLLGKNKRGELLIGYVRLPGQTFIEPILRARAPKMNRSADAALELAVPVENFGQVQSAPGTVEVLFKPGAFPARSAQADIPAIAPYGQTEVAITIPAEVKTGTYDVEVIIHSPGQPPATLQTRKVNVP